MRKSTSLKKPTILKIVGSRQRGMRRKGAMVFHEELFRPPQSSGPAPACWSRVYFLCMCWFSFIKNQSAVSLFPFLFPFLLFSTSERLSVCLTWYSSFFSTCTITASKVEYPFLPTGDCCPLCRWAVPMFSTSTGPAPARETSLYVPTQSPFGVCSFALW